MTLEPGGAVASHPAVLSPAAGNGPPAVTGQLAAGAGGQALAEPAVSCAGVTYRFGDHVAVDDVDLTIGPGETFGLLGPNGAGKTTTIRMLVTLLKPMAGRISVFGADAAARPMRVRRMIGYVPQLLSADGSLTGRENVELFARLFDVPRSGRTQRVEEAWPRWG
ncbi:MAG: ATP-binding cassette domain-containing protein [Streptosporangiaceae bacterium]